MADYLQHAVLVAAVFSGAVVAGFAGFGFPAVAGAALLHVLPATAAIPLMMVCGSAIQAFSTICLRSSMEWKSALPYMIGGVVGMPLALQILGAIDDRTFRLGFAAFLIAYTSYMLARPNATALSRVQARPFDAFVGFSGGFVGGLTAMPGALPMIWCDLRGLPKERQRGTIQPFILPMQALGIVLFLHQGRFSGRVLSALAVSIPAAIAGAAIALLLFRRADGSMFRRLSLLLLLLSGLALASGAL